MLNTENRTTIGILASEAMQRAFATEVLGAWPEGAAYRLAAQPEAIGAVLVETLHRHLTDAQIAFVYREKMKTRDKVVLAKASLAGSKLEFFTDIDLVVEVNWETWGRLTDEQRAAVMDHELCHFGMEEDENGTKYVLLHHDVEEFGAIVTRWGLWKPDLRDFGLIVKEQRDLFDSVESVELIADGKSSGKMTRRSSVKKSAHLSGSPPAPQP